MSNPSFLPAGASLDRTDTAHVAAEAFLAQYSNPGTHPSMLMAGLHDAAS